MCHNCHTLSRLYKQSFWSWYLKNSALANSPKGKHFEDNWYKLAPYFNAGVLISKQTKKPATNFSVCLNIIKFSWKRHLLKYCHISYNSHTNFLIMQITGAPILYPKIQMKDKIMYNIMTHLVSIMSWCFKQNKLHCMLTANGRSSNCWYTIKQKLEMLTKCSQQIINLLWYIFNKIVAWVPDCECLALCDKNTLGAACQFTVAALNRHIKSLWFPFLNIQSIMVTHLVSCVQNPSADTTH